MHIRFAVPRHPALARMVIGATVVLLVSNAFTLAINGGTAPGHGEKAQAVASPAAGSWSRDETDWNNTASVHCPVQ